MSKVDYIQLKNNSTLKHVTKGYGSNIIFFPGGPGLGSEYFETLFLSENKTTANIFTFNYPKAISHLSDEQILSKIKEDIYEVLTKLTDITFVGHSFGGMLLQCLDFTGFNLRNLILLNSSPSLKCFDLAPALIEKFPDDQIEKILKASEDYQANKSNSTFKSMFKAWAPYYVTPPFQETFKVMIDRCEVSFELYEWGERYFFIYFQKNAIKNDKNIIISSFGDNLCPISLFDEFEYQKNTKIILQSTSHFPWLDNLNILKIISENV